MKKKDEKINIDRCVHLGLFHGALIVIRIWFIQYILLSFISLCFFLRWLCGRLSVAYINAFVCSSMFSALKWLRYRARCVSINFAVIHEVKRMKQYGFSFYLFRCVISLEQLIDFSLFVHLLHFLLITSLAIPLILTTLAGCSPHISLHILSRIDGDRYPSTSNSFSVSSTTTTTYGPILNTYLVLRIYFFHLSIALISFHFAETYTLFRYS